MPLYRQEQMWKRMGVALKRGTMANWVIQVADLYLRPFWKRIRSELLTQSAIHADETVMQVHKEKGRPDTSEAHLCAFLEHGEIEVSNNQVESAIRPFVIGRKGWLFADTPQGAEASVIIYSLMETAKANSLRLDDYLLHLLIILPERAERNKDFEVDDLLPWSEEMKSWFSAV